MNTFFRTGVLLAGMIFIAQLISPPAQAALSTEGRRVALVLGNSNYANTISLPNTANDARAMTAALTRLGFDVVSGVDQSHAQMNQSMKTFARKLVGADVALFYYAGHGMQVSGANYLVPVDAELAQETDLQFEAVKVTTIVDRLMLPAKVKIVILDSCRDNPLAVSLARSMSPLTRSTAAPSAGLSAMSTSATGTLVAFATAPGHVALDGTGDHSPFTAALLEHIETPGLDIDVMMKRVRGHVAKATDERQQPWTNSALNGEFFLKPGQVASLQPAAPQLASGGQSAVSTPPTTTLSADTLAQIDVASWNAADRGGRGLKADYENYLTKHPTGIFAAQARKQIARLNGNSAAASTRTASLGGVAKLPATNSGPAATQESERALGWSRNEWRRLQRQLTSVGFSTGGADGRPGPATRQALENWQSARGFPNTGYLNALQRTELLSEVVPDDVLQQRRASHSKSRRNSATKSRSARAKSGRKTARRKKRGGSNAGSSLAKGIGIGVGIAVGSTLLRKW